MKLLKRAAVVFGTLFAAVALFGYLQPMTLALFVAALTKAHVEGNRPVHWQTGPQNSALPATQRPPNIIVILADDMGYNGFSLHGGGVGNSAVKTPSIDRIAREGVEFSNGYAGDATCAPSRAAIITGRYATRFGFEFTPTPAIYGRLFSLAGNDRGEGELPVLIDTKALEALPPMEDEAIPAGETTIADILQKQGYHTLQIGKWHLGGKAGSRPEDKGFDESLGFMPGASLYAPEDDPDVVNAKVDYSPTEKFLWSAASWSVQYNGSALFKPATYMTDYLTDEAVKAIHANRNRPFFMFFAPNAIHAPLQAPREDYDALPMIADHTMRVYGAMTRNLDRNIGRLLDSLKREGLDDNTLVVFTSDNGGTHVLGLADINKPYRGWKATFFEGGLRVPIFMRWPQKIVAGTTYAPSVAHVDIAAVAAAAAGTQLSSERKTDGVDLLPYLTGERSGVPHANLFWRSGDSSVVLEGDWKLQHTRRPDKQWLYHIKSDPQERSNLAERNPKKLEALAALMESIDHEQAAPLWPSSFAVPVPIDHPLGVPFKSTDEYTYWNN